MVRRRGIHRCEVCGIGDDEVSSLGVNKGNNIEGERGGVGSSQGRGSDEGGGAYHEDRGG